MNKIFAATLIVLAMTSSCGWNNVPPGYGGIKVNFYGTDKGVEETPVVTGMQFYNPFSERIVEFPVFTQSAIWTQDLEEGSPTNEEISFASQEGMGFTADISLSYELVLEKLPYFYVKFRTDDLDTFTHGFMRNVARKCFTDLAPRYSAEELYSTKTEALVTAAQACLNLEVNQFGVHVTQFGIIGRPRPPKEIVERINAKVAATQKAQQAENELRQTQAEAAKNVAEAKGNAEADIARAEGASRAQIVRAEGEAKANAILSASINDSLIAWRGLEIKARFVDKWQGLPPNYLAIGDKGPDLMFNAK